jgi:hypothetical protein
MLPERVTLATLSAGRRGSMMRAAAAQGAIEDVLCPIDSPSTPLSAMRFPRLFS